MTDNVTEFPSPVSNETPVPRVLARAAGEGLRGVLVIGYRKNGRRYFASSYDDSAEILWLLEKAKADLMELTE